MSHLRAFFCREYRDYALFGVEFLAEICQKFSEILRILAEILRKKLATGASVVNEMFWIRREFFFGFVDEIFWIC